MRSAVRLRMLAAVLVVSVATAALAGYAVARTGHAASSSTTVKRFSLAGYVLDTKYTKGRNTGNTFKQTYKKTTVHGVPIAGPYVGTKFPVEDYVAMAIGNHELYVAWQDTKTHALLDVFVMNMKTHKVWDYAPGSTHPESTGTVTVVKAGKQKVH